MLVYFLNKNIYKLNQMSKLTKKAKQFLYDYHNNFSPTGFEKAGQDIWLDYITPYVDETFTDRYGTAYGVINPGQPYKVVIEAHADEIAWYVNYITDSGMIYVSRNGGSDHIIAPSKRVVIHTKKGKVKGVFGWPAIHTRRGKSADLSPKMDNIFIDIGASSKKDVEKLGVLVGNVITFDDEFHMINNTYYTGRALDNRMGGFCIAEVAARLKKSKTKLPYSLYIVNAVQEEIGLRGAEMIAATIKPDVAIVTDVTHVTNTPMINMKIHGEIKAGDGPSLTVAPAVHNKLLDLMMDVADAKKIPYQRSASSRSTGTDTDAFAYSGGGIVSALISIPLKYMHTTVEMAHKNDVENVIKLYIETLKAIKKNHDFSYFK
jgi:putative aminopeptidase FrvX